MRCPACDGARCEQCGDGWITLTGCPAEAVDSDTIQAFRAAYAYRKGIAPLSGGYFEQLPAIMEAIEMIMASEPSGLDELNG